MTTLSSTTRTLFLLLLAAHCMHHAMPIAAAKAAAGLDACGILAKTPAYHAAKACINAFPYDAGRAAAIVDSVQKTLPLYVFLDAAKDSPDKMFQKDYDVEAAVQSIAEKVNRASTASTPVYRNDRAFQDALADVFVPLNDAHTSYTPHCYRKLTYTLPFYPVARTDPSTDAPNTPPKIFVAGVSSAEHAKPYAKYLGAEITAIDSQPAFARIWDYAQSVVGSYKDPMARFNRALAKMNFNNTSWVPLQGSFMSRARLPEMPTVTITLKSAVDKTEEVVSVPWSVKLPAEMPFHDDRSYWKQFCAPAAAVEEAHWITSLSSTKESSSTKAHKTRKASSKHLQSRRRHHEASNPNRELGFTELDYNNDEKASAEAAATPVLLLADNGTILTTGPSIPEPIIKSFGLAYYTLPSAPTVAVLVVSTFDRFGKNEIEWRATIVEIFAHMRRHSVQKLILDLSNNGGGSACLASELVALLTPHPWLTFPIVTNQYKKDERLSPLMLKLHIKALEMRFTSFDPTYWTDVRTGLAFSGKEMYDPPRRRPRGANDPFPYTQLFRDSCTVDSKNPLVDITHSFHVPKLDYAMVTNGLCGSACGRVQFHLSELDNIQTFVTGGIRAHPRSASGFPAAQVVEHKNVINDIDALGFTGDADMPTPFPVNATMRFAIRQSYSRTKTTVPLEFLYAEANGKIDWTGWNTLRPDRVWEQVAAKMGWMDADMANARIPLW